jgi:hypothetical protein
MSDAGGYPGDWQVPHWWAPCGCVCETEPGTGEPLAYLKQCAYHTGSTDFTLPMQECRAMTLARMSVAAAAGIGVETTWAETDPQTREGVCTSPDGQWTARIAPVTLAGYLGAHAQAAAGAFAAKR